MNASDIMTTDIITVKKETSLKELARILYKHHINGVPVVDDEGNLGLGIDIRRPEDKVVEYQGAALLVVEPALADTLNNIAIDVENNDEGNQLVIVDTPQ